MTREQKLALIVGFSLILLVGVLISDHLSRARSVQIAGVEAEEQGIAAASRPNLPDAVRPVADSMPGEQSPSMPVPVATNSPANNQANDQLGNPTGNQSNPGTLIAMGPATAQYVNPAAEPGAGPADATSQLLEQLRDTARSALKDTGITDVNLPPATSVERLKTSETPRTEPLPAPEVSTTWYTVQQGETLFQIAKRQYGTGQAWKQLAELNKGRVSQDGAVKAGVRIELFDSLPGSKAAPSKTPSKPTEKPTDKPADKPSEKPTSRPATGEQRITRAEPKADIVKAANTPRTYTVRKGDSLGEISQKMLGTMRRKDEIVDLNKGILDDEDSIQVGMVLKMPTR